MKLFNRLLLVSLIVSLGILPTFIGGVAYADDPVGTSNLGIFDGFKAKPVVLHFDSDVPGKWGAFAITLYPNIYFAVPLGYVHKDIIKHEFIHVEQIERSSALWFYTTYVLNFLFNTVVDKHSAYVNILYEKEARRRCMENWSERDYEILHANNISKFD
jgi:hypothetical protein